MFVAVKMFVAVFLGNNRYWPVFFFFFFLSPGAPEGSTSSGSGFKASQNTGHSSNSHSAD